MDMFRVNKPTQSKINYVSAIVWIIAMLAKFGILPITGEQVELINEMIVVSLPPIIVVLRTFFTNKPI